MRPSISPMHPPRTRHGFLKILLQDKMKYDSISHVGMNMYRWAWTPKIRCVQVMTKNSNFLVGVCGIYWITHAIFQRI